jgi:hypothetical protein
MLEQTNEKEKFERKKPRELGTKGKDRRGMGTGHDL